MRKQLMSFEQVMGHKVMKFLQNIKLSGKFNPNPPLRTPLALNIN